MGIQLSQKLLIVQRAQINLRILWLTLLCCMYLICFLGWPALGMEPDPAEVFAVENALLKTIESTSLAAEVAGNIEQLSVVEGDHVQIGQPLGKIRDSAVRLQVQRAEIALALATKKQRSDIDLRLARERAAVAENELQRHENANATFENTYGPKEIDRLRLIASSAQLEIERAAYERELLELDRALAENDLLQAQELLERHQIQAPAMGVVVALKRRIGEWVEPGTDVLQIVKIDRLRVEGFLSSAAVNRDLSQASAQVKVLTEAGEQQLEGKLSIHQPRYQSRRSTHTRLFGNRQCDGQPTSRHAC